VTRPALAGGYLISTTPELAIDNFQLAISG
jgi:hypothetical protein